MHQEIRANYNKNTITVYQAYNDKIALPAMKNNKFQSPFSFNRMTWVKPSFLWLMARSNWGIKSNQEYTLAIKLKRDFWDKMLSLGVLTHPDEKVYTNRQEWAREFEKAKVHIQWDPERTIRNAKLEYRTIQVGISRYLIEEYNNSGIQEIVDYTPLVKKISKLRKEGKYKEAKRLLPIEKVYPVSDIIKSKIGVY